VAFADEAHPLEPTERALYPEPTETHRAIRCEASSGGGWLEVTFADPAEASEVVAGRRVVLTPAMAAGGRHGYVVARYVRTLGARPATIEGPGEGAPAAESGLGFDFGRLRNEPAQARAARMCVVDFVGEVELVDPRTRARVGYPAGTQNRLNVKCLHQGGDSWIDLVFDQTEADAALGVVPGAEIGVAIIAPSGGFADRPITRLAEET